MSTFNVAVGAQNGFARLNRVVGEATSQGCSIRELQGLSYLGHMRVRVVTLDTVEFPVPPTVLVVDCEGFEGEVLLGARNMMDRVRMLFVETHVIGNGHSTLSGVLSQVEAVPMKADVFLSEDRLSWISGTRSEPHTTERFIDAASAGISRPLKTAGS